MLVRFATNEDVSRLSVYREQADEAHILKYEKSSKERLLSAQSGITYFLVCEENNCVIGEVFLKLNGTKTQPGYPSLEDLFITPSSRGLGAGSMLIHACEEIAKKFGYKEIGLGVNPLKNIRAKKLYERLGYKDVGTSQYLDGVYDGVEDWVIDMKKKL